MRSFKNLLLLLLVTPLVSAQSEDDQSNGMGNGIGNGMDDGPQIFEMARIISDQSRASDCLAAVAVTRIDGQPRVVSAQGFLIEPGVHTLNGRASLDTRYCNIESDDRQFHTAVDLEINFEAGSNYYIAYDYNSPIADNRRLVVWKVEQISPSEIIVP
jgi:hypothetical protein